MSEIWVAPQDGSADAAIRALNFVGPYRYPSLVAFRDGKPVGGAIAFARDDVLAVQFIGPSMHLLCRLGDFYDQLADLLGLECYVAVGSTNNDGCRRMYARLAEMGVCRPLGEDDHGTYHLRMLRDV